MSDIRGWGEKRGSGGRRAALALGAAAVLAAVPGCNIIAGATLLVHGPEKIPKLYDLDSAKKTVVFVDDRENQLPRRSLRQSIGESATKVLLDENVVKEMIDTRSALGATSSEKAGQPLNIVDIGRRVGADRVIYVSVDRFTLSPDGTSFAPESIVNIKVMDVLEEKRLWPLDEKLGYRMVVRPPKPPKNLPQSVSEVAQAENEFAKVVGTAIAQAFYSSEAKGSARNTD
jgi:hypothetical protein